jgi:hypothetical protein
MIKKVCFHYSITQKEHTYKSDMSRCTEVLSFPTLHPVAAYPTRRFFYDVSLESNTQYHIPHSSMSAFLPGQGEGINSSEVGATTCHNSIFSKIKRVRINCFIYIYIYIYIYYESASLLFCLNRTAKWSILP